MAHSAVRQSLRIKILNATLVNTENQESKELIETHGFPSPSLNGFGFSKD
jgi:hypothetical protein